VGGGDPRVERIDVSAYTIPTETAEFDGTLEGDGPTLVLVEVRGGGHAGLGFSYAAAATAQQWAAIF
jgi:hypothetical protein